MVAGIPDEHVDHGSNVAVTSGESQRPSVLPLDVGLANQVQLLPNALTPCLEALGGGLGCLDNINLKAVTNSSEAATQPVPVTMSGFASFPHQKKI